VRGCSRRGVRGYEDIIDGKFVCEECHARMISNKEDRDRELRRLRESRRHRV
jgi:hypothetical protein